MGGTGLNRHAAAACLLERASTIRGGALFRGRCFGGRGECARSLQDMGARNAKGALLGRAPSPAAQQGVDGRRKSHYIRMWDCEAEFREAPPALLRGDGARS